MTDKFLRRGDVLTHNPSAAVSSGDVVAMGDSVGVALADIAANKDGAVQVEGVFNLPKTSGTAWVQGDSLDWDASASEFTKDIAIPATGDIEDCAIAAADAASADTTGQVKLANPGTVT